MGFSTVVVSNQSGVARGMFSENDVILVNRRMDEMLLADNPAAVIDRHEFCPFHPEAPLEQYRRETHLRKPGPGMILEAAEKLALDLSRSWLIGDAPRDIEAGKAAGCRTILLHLPDLPSSPAASEKLNTPPDCIVASLKEAMDFIEKSLQTPENPPGTSSGSSSQAGNAAPPATAPATENVLKPDRLENLAEQILTELRQRNQHADYADFSISKLMAGIVQVIAVALMFLAYLAYTRTGDKGWDNFYSLMAYALFFQMFTISLLIMGRQR
jgi:histidinol-phosphate phosphatase family protein